MKKRQRLSLTQALWWWLTGKVKCPVCWGARRIDTGQCPTCEGRGWVRKLR